MWEPRPGCIASSSDGTARARAISMVRPYAVPALGALTSAGSTMQPDLRSLIPQIFAANCTRSCRSQWTFCRSSGTCIRELTPLNCSFPFMRACAFPVPFCWRSDALFRESGYSRSSAFCACVPVPLQKVHRPPAPESGVGIERFNDSEKGCGYR